MSQENVELVSRFSGLCTATLRPLVGTSGAAAMAASSVTVVANALRLRGFRSGAWVAASDG
jgi:cation transport ATPase